MEWRDRSRVGAIQTVPFPEFSDRQDRCLTKLVLSNRQTDGPCLIVFDVRIRDDNGLIRAFGEYKFDQTHPRYARQRLSPLTNGINNILALQDCRARHKPNSHLSI